MKISDLVMYTETGDVGLIIGWRYTAATYFPIVYWWVNNPFTRYTTPVPVTPVHRDFLKVIND